MQGKINRGRHTNHLAGHHSIPTKQCPIPPSPYFSQAGCPSCCPTNNVKALKAISIDTTTSIFIDLLGHVTNKLCLVGGKFRLRLTPPTQAVSLSNLALTKIRLSQNGMNIHVFQMAPGHESAL